MQLSTSSRPPGYQREQKADVSEDRDGGCDCVSRRPINIREMGFGDARAATMVGNNCEEWKTGGNQSNNRPVHENQMEKETEVG